MNHDQITNFLRYRPEGGPSQPKLDLTLFLNGLPVFTAELKNQFTGQNVEDARKQYKRGRPSTEPLFKLGRCLALKKSYEVNPPQTVRLTFDQVAEQLFAEMIDNYYEFYKKVTDDPQAKQRFFDWLFEQYRRGAQ